jgi:pyruvate dehydrogenase E1 component
LRAQLLGSGPILREVLRAQEILKEKYGIDTDVWSVPSYKELRRDALESRRWNLLHPDRPPRTSYVEQCLGGSEMPIIATSDYLKLVPEQIAPWLGGRLVTLGTDGFGRSDIRPALRRHFEIDAEHIAFTTLSALSRQGKFEVKRMRAAVKELGIDTERMDPVKM